MEILAENARQLLGLELSAEQLARFEQYYRELVSYNEKVNLTAIIEYEAVQIRHFLDSLTLASPILRGDKPDKAFDISTAALVDIGAGAGFPGLPLKIIYPEIRLTLVESVGKKAIFLREIAEKLEMTNVTVLTERAEEIGQMAEHRAQYNLATGRAVAALAILAEYCLPLVKIGGLFIALKKGKLGEEITAAQKAIGILGGQLRRTPGFQLPQDTPDDERKLIVVEKVKKTPSTFPRKIGIPSKQPLG